MTLMKMLSDALDKWESLFNSYAIRVITLSLAFMAIFPIAIISILVMINIFMEMELENFQ